MVYKYSIEKLSYINFVKACKKIANEIKKYNITSIFGIPRGGLVPAVYLSHLTGLPLVKIADKRSLIVDDIADSGCTLLGYQMQGYKIATIYYCKHSLVIPNIWIYEKKADWIRFPWEV